MGDADPLADDRPGRRFIRRPEGDRPQPPVALLEATHQRVALADRREPGGVDVEGQDAGDLGADRLGIGGAHHLADDGAAGFLFLLEVDADGAPVAVHREGEVQVPGGVAMVGGRGEALQQLFKLLEYCEPPNRT